MLKIRALNRDSSSDDDAPTIRREAQEEITLDLYNKALRLNDYNQLDEAEEILKKLLDENIPLLESQGGLPKTMSTLKYSCYLNLGNGYLKKGETKNALENYLKASDLDKTDVTLWYKIGTLALKSDRFRQAAYAFSKGLERNESHWPCLDQIIPLLFAMNDTITCLVYIGKALILDPEYVKGLVLRKRIYEYNPATKEYYKLFNPDYVLEPCLDIQIDEVDEHQYLAEAQKVCDQINAVEEALKPKPLPCIPLPTPLKEFTWVALGHTIIDVHRYLTNNNMSHICKIDLNKCMTQLTADEAVVEDEPIENQEVQMEVVVSNVEDVAAQEPNEEQMESEANVERRMSQNSEVNFIGDCTENNLSAVQTDDNDEMEQDTEDQDESESKTDKTKSQNKGTKRRRDLLSDLQIWGWHSKRKSAKKQGKYEKDLTIEGALIRIIPSYLLPNGLNGGIASNVEDSMNTMDLYHMYIEDKQQVTLLSPLHSPQVLENDEAYFGSQTEKDDVLKFWTKEWNTCDAVNLVEEYVYCLASRWHIQWPVDLINLYIEAYNMFREHCEHPPPFNTEITFEEKKKDGLATLLYGELLTFRTNREHKQEIVPIHPTSLGHLQIISSWDADWKNEWLPFRVRVNWLRAHIFRKENENQLAIQSLQLINEEILLDEAEKKCKYVLSLPNCNKYGTVNCAIIQKLLKHLELIDSLGRLEELFNNQYYTEVAEIIRKTCVNTINPPTSGRIGRPAQIGMLLNSLWFIDKSECFIWSESCLHEALGHFLKPVRDQDKWEMVLNKCLLMLHEIIKDETVTIVDLLPEVRRSRLVETLSRIVCKQLNSENGTKIPLGNITAWIVLYYVLLREDHRTQAKKVVNHLSKKKHKKSSEDPENENSDEEELPSSIAVLFAAHEFLGPKSWCLTGKGELLHFLLDTILDRLDTPIFENLRDKIDIHLEQAFFCLYQHPSKKNKVSRHLADHNVNPLPLHWDRAQQLFEFYCPDMLPEFDSYKSISISSDLEQLLQRIKALVPKECDPQPHIQKVSDFVHGNANILPQPIIFSHKIRAIYYLLGDYYFKQNEIACSFKYFLLDLSINPLRLDTWADIALGIASQLESKLNHCERFKTEAEFLDKAKSAQVCFRQALKLANDHITLWIEFGAFQYMVHSFCSRVLKSDSDTLSMEKFEVLENQKESYLNSSGESFTKALDLYCPEQTDADERWLHHYMLAKICEKRQREPAEYLQHYLTAGSLLHENKATYPDKINYNNPQHLAVEALEIHYRIHASILKYLELHEGKNILCNIGKLFKKCLDSSIFNKISYDKVNPNKEVQPKSNEPDNSKENDLKQDIPVEVKKCMEDVLKQVEQMSNGKEDKDVIMISDSDDEKNNLKQINDKPESKMKGKNIQEIMDALMVETMAKQQDLPMDTDSDTNNAESDALKTIDEELGRKIEELNTQSNSTKGADKPETVSKNNENTDEPKQLADDGGNIQKSFDETSSTSSSSSDSSSSDSDTDDSSSSASSTTSSDVSAGFLSQADVSALVDLSITGLEQCITRLPQNYKALYRLAHLFFHYNLKKDVNKCRQLLLGEYKCKTGVTVTGLFSERKTNNFFNGVWRIPSSEIDRAGSLAAHMARCVFLLLQVLRTTNDHKMLLDVCLQLKRTPDADKIYIRHAEREQLSEQALSFCIQSLRIQIKNLNVTNISSAQKFIMDIFRSYQRVQKHIPTKESTFTTILTDAYRKIMHDKLPENVNVLDLTIKYCQQSKAAEKFKQQQQNSLPRTPLLSTTPPVLPTPSSIGASNLNQPLKRPGLGRPRGRPPGPKQPAFTRSPRGRSPSVGPNPMAWQSLMYDPKQALNYMMQYQEEFLRQYAQNLSLSQLNLNQIAQKSIANQFLAASAPGNLLNPTQLIQTLNQLGSSSYNNPLTSNQLSQSLNHLNPSLLKKLSATQTNTSVSASGSQPKSSTITSVSNQPSISSDLNLDKILQLTATKSTSVANKSSTNFPQFNLPSSTQISPSKLSTKSNLGHLAPFALPSYTKAPTVSNFKYPSMVKPKVKDPSIIPIKEFVKPAAVKDSLSKATNIMKDRPNISITPVTQGGMGARPLNPLIPTSPGKTLQEKLADKQKQHAINKNVSRNLDYEYKNIEKMSRSLPQASYLPTTSTYSKPALAPPIAHVPTFPMDSGISISQVPIIKATKSSDTTSAATFHKQTQQLNKSKLAEELNKTKLIQDLGRGKPELSKSIIKPKSLQEIVKPKQFQEVAKTNPYQEVVKPKPPFQETVKSKSFQEVAKPKQSSSQAYSSKLYNLPPNTPISVSVIKKPEERTERKHSSDDDVIIIE